MDIAKNAEGSIKASDWPEGWSAEAFESFLWYGQYAKQIKTFLEYFDMHQMLFLKTEELYEYPAETMNKVFSFLGVKPVPVNARVIHSNEHIPIKAEDREFLRREYADSISALESLLGWDLSHWS